MNAIRIPSVSAIKEYIKENLKEYLNDKEESCRESYYEFCDWDIFDELNFWEFKLSGMWDIILQRYCMAFDQLLTTK